MHPLLAVLRALVARHADNVLEQLGLVATPRVEMAYARALGSAPTLTLSRQDAAGQVWRDLAELFFLDGAEMERTLDGLAIVSYEAPPSDDDDPEPYLAWFKARRAEWQRRHPVALTAPNPKLPGGVERRAAHLETVREGSDAAGRPDLEAALLDAPGTLSDADLRAIVRRAGNGESAVIAARVLRERATGATAQKAA